MSLSIIILAAGKGTRMRSDLPKVLHPLANKPMLGHVIDCARSLSECASLHIVYGHQGQQLQLAFNNQNDLNWHHQAKQLGTAHAVGIALATIPDNHQVLVLYGDVPLITKHTLNPLLSATKKDSLGVLTALMDKPQGYGRIIRNAQSQVTAIVEERDANNLQREICEVNTGILLAQADFLKRAIDRIDNENSQGEYYLTDVIAEAVLDTLSVYGVIAEETQETLGVNDRLQLATMERLYQQRQAQTCLRNGVTLKDPARFDLRGEFSHGTDCSIDINVLLKGQVTLGNRVNIGANCVIEDAVIGDDVTIQPNTVVQQAHVGNGCQLGPFARLRPGAILQEDVRVGNFVEIKKSTVGSGTKINHLSYVGDALIGEKANLGAGTITCNYDGANKSCTIIGDEAFIGSATQLVAPVEIGQRATIGAGSTITKDAPADTLTLSRSKQVSLRSWKRPVKKHRGH